MFKLCSIRGGMTNEKKLKANKNCKKVYVNGLDGMKVSKLMNEWEVVAYFISFVLFRSKVKLIVLVHVTRTRNKLF